MNTATIWFDALPWMLALAVAAWGVATAKRNAGLVDIFWSLFLLTAVLNFAARADETTSRAVLVLALTGFWAIRLSAYLALRNWNAPEDHRYRAIRARNEPGFAWKSIYLVFGLQAVLAWIIAAPLATATTSNTPLGFMDVTGTVAVIFGIVYESVADAQLARFKADPANVGQVMNRGLWRYSRHPNYFGESCVWWGFWLIAAGAGGAWTIFSPLLMTLLLLRISGVALLEKDIGERRPAYAGYVTSTNAFIPGPRRTA